MSPARMRIGLILLLLVGLLSSCRTTTLSGGITLIAPFGASIEKESPTKLTCKTGRWTLKIDSGDLILNGVYHGFAQSGDRVRLSKTGTLSVNGVVRDRNY